MDPLISIVIPTYNSGLFLRECLNSVVNQTYKNTEVLIVDGGSTDNTIQIVKEYCDKHINWKLLNSDKGVSKQRNVGLNHYNGEYLFFLDSDDYISENLIQLLLNHLVTNNLDFITPSICSVYIDDSHKIVKNILLTPRIIHNVNISNFFEEEYDSFLAGPTKLYRRDLLTNIRFNQNLSTGEDLLFNYDIVKNKPIKFDICCEAIYYYRHNIIVTNPIEKRMGKSGYLFCNYILKIIRKLDQSSKNYLGAYKILETHVSLNIKAYISKKKKIPILLIKPRLYLFNHTKRKLRYFYLFPRLYTFIFRKLYKKTTKKSQPD